MPRYHRIKSVTGIYHVMVRGVDRMSIFREEADYQRFLDILLRFKESDNYEIYAYCLMSNHVHLLIKEWKDTIDRSMKRIGVSYVSYFNQKYSRVGHLFQDRYRSKCVESEQYLLGCSRYIHLNPIAAGLVDHPESYRWSSYSYYLREENNLLLNTDFILDHFSLNRSEAIVKWKQFMESYDEDKYLGDESTESRDLQEIISKILARYNLNLDDLRKVKDIRRRDIILQEIKENTDASIREISQLLGMSKDVIFRA